MRKAFTLLSAFYALAVCLAADLPKIEVVGNKFFYANNGSQFYIRGIAYQQDTTSNTAADVTNYVDPLADADACKRDVKYLAQANTNVLRVYAVDPTLNHDSCMKTFADAGIYIIADLSEPKTSINRVSPEWNLDLYNRYTSVVDMFANYSNVLGFFAGNEVTNNKTNTNASAFVKAAVRDMKAYIKQKNWSFPVGYSSNDDADTRVAIADYFACGDLDERADFFGINMYEWCGDTTFAESGYKDRTADFQNLTVPIFFSEYGCNEVRPRKFTEVAALYGDEMTSVWSGGIVYMYFEETNKYGLVSVSGSSVSTLDDFSYYSKEINSINPSLATKSAVGAAQTQTLACPASGATWAASPILPPTPDKKVCDCVYDSLKCVVNDKVEVKNYGELYNYICAQIDCSAVSGNGTTGTYGVVSFCSDKEKLSYMLNAYYENQNKASSACGFQGSATLQSKVTVASTCSAAVSSVSKNATASPSPTSSSGSSGSSNSSSGSSSSPSQAAKSSKAAGNVVARAASKAELVAIGAMVMCVVGGFTTFFA